MKLKTTLLLATLGAFAATTAFANEEHHPDAKAEKAVQEQKAASDAGDKSMKNMDMHQNMKTMHDKDMPMMKHGEGMNMSGDKQLNGMDKQTGMKEEVKKPLKKHNHMEEKTGMPMPEPMQDMHKEMPSNRHDHMKEKH